MCKQSIREDIDHKALIGIRFMYRLHIMHPSNPRDEQRHYPINLHGLKRIGVMETPENVVDEDGSDEAWNTPRPASWSPPLASFPPSALILATSSSNSLLHLAAVIFW
jgi:hypothetical protein